MKKFYLTIQVLIIATTLFAQDLKPIAKKIADATSQKTKFGNTLLFAPIADAKQLNTIMEPVVSQATFLQFNDKEAKQLVNLRSSFLNFVIPTDSGVPLELQLFLATIFTPDFTIVTSENNGQPVSYSGGVHYQGIIKGDNNSIAAISIFNDEVMGMISSPTIGNLVLGKLENDAQSVHIFYNDANLLISPEINCFTAEDNRAYEPKELQEQHKSLTNCIRLFWEVNYDIYQNKGSVTNAANYVTGLFNQSAIIYTNGGIPVELSEVYVWNTISPYTATTTSAQLALFKSTRNSINGDLGHLLGLTGGGGIAAGFNGICNSNLDFSQCYSMIYSSYSNVPTYSWSVMVVTHEQGHLMGSRHTHACVWNGNNTAIDNCGPTAGYGYEGGCSNAPTPVGGGTIMSYCHLVGSVGINFSNGFGPQPIAVILNNFTNGLCLTSCFGNACMPSASMTTSGIADTSATFSWNAVTGATGYNIRYRIIGNVNWAIDTSSFTTYNATGLVPGTSYEWQVQTVCSTGTSTYTISTNFITIPLFCLSPAGTLTTNTSYSTATFNWSVASGAINYSVRYRIVGSGTWTTATTAAITYNVSGLTASTAYEWQVSTNCSGGGTSAYSSSVLFTTLAPPCLAPQNIYTTNITSTSATLNWLPVSGAISYYTRHRIIGTVNWTNNTSGGSPYIITGLQSLSNYEWQISVSCPGGQSPWGYSSLFTTLCATPSATITANGSTTFCSGGNVLLTASSGIGYSYQWYLNGNIIPGMISMNYPASASGSYTVLITSNTCSATSPSLTVLVNPLPLVNSLSVSGCDGTPVSLSGTPAGGSFSVNNPYTGPSTTYTYMYTDSNGCSNTSAASTITINPLPTVSFSGLAISYNSTDSPAFLTGTPTGGTFTGIGITGNIFDPSAAGVGGPYTIAYSYTDSNGCLNSSTMQTTVNNCLIPGQPVKINQVGGTTKVCPGDIKTYSIANVAGATSYTWTAPLGGVITTGQGTKTIVVSYQNGFIASGILSVTANNICGNSNAKTKTITRNTPAIPGTITGQSSGVCNANGIPYSVTNVAGITYNWSFNVGTASVATGQGSNSITADYSNSFTTGILQVTAGNGCGISAAKILTVKALASIPGAITGATVVCANQSGVPYSVSPVIGATSYTWSGPSGSRFSDGVTTSTTATFTTTANAVTVNFASTAGSIKVKAINTCGTSLNKTLAVAFVCREDITTLKKEINFSLFPNPASTEIKLNFYSTTTDDYHIRVTDILGKTIITKSLISVTGENEITIALETLSKGIYALELKNKSFTRYKKFVVE